MAGRGRGADVDPCRPASSFQVSARTSCFQSSAIDESLTTLHREAHLVSNSANCMLHFYPGGSASHDLFRANRLAKRQFKRSFYFAATENAVGDGLPPLSAAIVWADIYAHALYEADIQQLVLPRWHTHSFRLCYLLYISLGTASQEKLCYGQRRRLTIFPCHIQNKVQTLAANGQRSQSTRIVEVIAGFDKFSHLSELVRRLRNALYSNMVSNKMLFNAQCNYSLILSLTMKILRRLNLAQFPLGLSNCLR